MIKIQPMTPAEFFADPYSAELVEAYRAECANPDFGITPPPDRNRYEMLHACGQMAVFGAFDSGCLVGFITVLLSPVPHFDGMPLAVVESVFCAQAYRSKGVGLKLLRAAKEAAANRGAAGLYVSAPVGSRFEALMARLARRTNSVYFWSTK